MLSSKRAQRLELQDVSNFESSLILVPWLRLSLFLGLVALLWEEEDLTGLHLKGKGTPGYVLAPTSPHDRFRYGYFQTWPHSLPLSPAPQASIT